MKTAVVMRTTEDTIKGPIDILNTNFPDRDNLVALEIGSYAGQSAQLFLSTGKIKEIYCIDPWEDGYDPSDPTSRVCAVAQAEFDKRFKEDIRVHKIKGYSQDKIKEFPDSFFDFVYIDGCHQETSVEADIKAVFPKLKQNGVLAGHDYNQSIPRLQGVIRAVNRCLGRSPQHLFSDTSWSIHKNLIQDKKRCMFCIISPGYEKKYRVMLDSFLKYNNGWDILLFYPGRINIPGVTEQIDITEDLKKFPVEYSTQARIWAFRASATSYCLLKYGGALYCDSDLMFYNTVPAFDKTVFTLHNNYSVPKEWFDIRCQDGFINTGFYFAHNDPQTLAWFNFTSDLYREGKVVHAITGGPRNTIWDQKIYLFLPFLCPAIYNIYKHDGCNVAAWNLCQRKITMRNEVLFSNKDPLICFHYSQSNWRRLNKFTQTNSVLRNIAQEYARQIGV